MIRPSGRRATILPLATAPWRRLPWLLDSLDYSSSDVAAHGSERAPMSLHLRLIRMCQAALDLTVLASAFILAFLLRFEGPPPPEFLEVMLVGLPCALAVKAACLSILGARRLSWRHIS